MAQLKDKSEREERRRVYLDIPAQEYDAVLRQLFDTYMQGNDSTASKQLVHLLSLLSEHLDKLIRSDWQVYADGLAETGTLGDEVVSLVPNAVVVEFLPDDEFDDDDDLIEDDNVDPRELLREALADVRAGRVYTEEEFWKALEDDAENTEQSHSGEV